MKVYDCKGFPNPDRVRIALAEKGLIDGTEFVQVDVAGGEHRTEEFRAINPSAVVPVLETRDGTLLSECSAITEYLDHLDGSPELTGRTAEERGYISMIQRKVEAGLLETVSDYFHNSTPGLGPDLETYQNAAWGEHRLVRAKATLKWLDEQLAEKTYVAGDRFTVADITAIAGLQFGGFINLTIPAEYKNLNRWYDLVKARPSVQAAA